jgi:hypothetical protein
MTEKHYHVHVETGGTQGMIAERDALADDEHACFLQLETVLSESALIDALKYAAASTPLSLDVALYADLAAAMKRRLERTACEIAEPSGESVMVGRDRHTRTTQPTNIEVALRRLLEYPPSHRARCEAPIRGTPDRCSCGMVKAFAEARAALAKERPAGIGKRQLEREIAEPPSDPVLVGRNGRCPECGVAPTEPSVIESHDPDCSRADGEEEEFA